MVQEYFEESHNILRQSVRKFLEREVLPYVEEWEDKEEFPRDLYSKAAEAGFLGLGCPEELGGTPADMFHRIAFVEEFLRSGSVGLVSGIGSYGIAIPPILSMGTEVAI